MTNIKWKKEPDSLENHEDFPKKSEFKYLIGLELLE